MDVTMARAMANCRLFISADEVNVLTQVERRAYRVKCCLFTNELVSSLHSLWGICSYHQIYVHLRQLNVPHRIKE
jgi:hypothetical protein